MTDPGHSWLVAQDRTPEALAILAKYHAGGDTNSPLVLRELAEIVEAIRLEKETKIPGWGALIETPGNRKRLFIAVFLGSAAQWNGESDGNLGNVVTVTQVLGKTPGSTRYVIRSHC